MTGKSLNNVSALICATLVNEFNEIKGFTDCVFRATQSGCDLKVVAISCRDTN